MVFLTAINDDCHAICVYREERIHSITKQKKKYYGAISRSFLTVLRSRDCVYESVKQVVMSYWDFYYGSSGEKTLCGYCA